VRITAAIVTTVIWAFASNGALAAACLHSETDRGYSFWVNLCSKAIIVKWVDQGYCNGNGCSGTVAADGRQRVIKLKGHYTWWECDYDAWAQGTCTFPGD
jgi:hypothetical protein